MAPGYLRNQQRFIKFAGTDIYYLILPDFDMAKKRTNFLKNIGEPPLGNTSGETSPQPADISDMLNEIYDNPMISSLMQEMPEEEQKTFKLMFELTARGVAPEEYASFYNFIAVLENTSKLLSEEKPRGKRTAPKEKGGQTAPLTLILKIQMKEVVKPPMWREVEVPSNANFLYLHDVIQTVMGLEDSHLWQFNARAYDNSLLIGERSDDRFGRGLDYVTDEASETPVSAYLYRKGARLEYVYDFGDDWIFTIEVKDVIDRESEYPVCLRYKSDLQPIEDTGGPWSYIAMREGLDKWDSLTKKKRKEMAESIGFDSPEDYIDFLKSHIISLSEINTHLSQMHNR